MDGVHIGLARIATPLKIMVAFDEIYSHGGTHSSNYSVGMPKHANCAGLGHEVNTHH